MMVGAGPDGSPWVAVVAVAAIAFMLALAGPAVVPMAPWWVQILPLLVAAAAAALPVSLALRAGERWAWVLALAVLLFVTDTSFRSRDWADKSWDWQVLLKAAVWLGCGAAGLLRLRTAWRLLAAPPGWLALAYLAVLAVSVLWSPVPAYSAQAAFAYFGLFLFALAAAQVLGEGGLLLAMALGLGAVVLPSLAVAPFAEGLAAVGRNSTGEPDRLRGLTDHPIAMAEVAALFTFACLALRVRARGFGTRLLLALLAMAGLAAAVLTRSRIPVVALLAAAGGVWACRKGGPLLMVPVLIACAGLVLLGESVSGFADLLPRDLLEMVSRSGSADEVLSLSGRLLIWPYALDRIRDAPLIGHGLASGIEVFRGFTPWKIVHAHDAYLQALLYVGLLGALPLAGTLLAQLRAFFRRPQTVRDTILLYTLFCGVTEQAMVANLPSGAVILWLIAVGLAAQDWRRAGSTDFSA